MPDADSNVLNTDDLASVSIMLDDLGESGEGGAQKSSPLTIGIVVKAVNDRPVLDMPGDLTVKEDLPTHIHLIRVSDIDADEPGGEILP